MTWDQLNFSGNPLEWCSVAKVGAVHSDTWILQTIMITKCWAAERTIRSFAFYSWLLAKAVGCGKHFNFCGEKSVATCSNFVRRLCWSFLSPCKDENVFAQYGFCSLAPRKGWGLFVSLQHTRHEGLDGNVGNKPDILRVRPDWTLESLNVQRPMRENGRSVSLICWNVVRTSSLMQPSVSDLLSPKVEELVEHRTLSSWKTSSCLDAKENIVPL